MKFLKIYDSFKVEDFKNFLKKYNKTDYMSVATIDKLNKLGIDKDSFQRVEDSIRNSLNFFVDNDNDKEIFEDFFLEIKDMVNFELNYKVDYYISVLPKSNKRSRYSDDKLEKFLIPISKSDIKDTDKSEKVLLERIILSIFGSHDNIKEITDKKRKEKKKSSIDYLLNNMNYKKVHHVKNFIDRCEIYPTIRVSIDTYVSQNNYNYYETDGEYRDRESKERYESIKLKSLIKDEIKKFMPNYLNLIGYRNTEFEVNEVYGYYYDNRIPEVDIIIKL